MLECFPLPSWKMFSSFYTNLSYKHTLWVCRYMSLDVDILPAWQYKYWLVMEMDQNIKDIRQARGIVTVCKHSILRLVNGSFESARTEEFHVWDRYWKSNLQNRRKLQASKLITDLSTIACPGPLLKLHMDLKILSNQNVNVWPLRLVFPYLIQKGG